MSNQSELTRFEADLNKSEDLRKRLDEALRRIVEEGKAKSDGEAMVAAAAELGYDITVAELERACAEAEDLDDDELEAVAGGNVGKYTTCQEDEKGHDWLCIATWHCYTVMLHTEAKQHAVACWSDYACVSLSNTDVNNGNIW